MISKGYRELEYPSHQPLYEDHILPGGNEKKRQFMDGLIEAVDQLDGDSLAVKPHPREDTVWYRETFPEERLHVYGGETDVNDAVWENRYAIGFFSAGSFDSGSKVFAHPMENSFESWALRFGLFPQVSETLENI